MKIYTAVTIFFILLTSCNQQSQNDGSSLKQETIAATSSSDEEKIVDCSEIEFKTVQEQADYLVLYFKKAQQAATTKAYERQFFCAFPSTFKNMQELFGDVNNESGPLYIYPQGEDVITYFQNLSTIPKSEYYNKYINICINGVWEADNIRDGFGFADKLLKDTEHACVALSERNDAEIKSIYHFIFDGPHPDNESNHELYNKLLPKITTQDKRLGKLLKQTFEEMLTEEDGHGH